MERLTTDDSRSRATLVGYDPSAQWEFPRLLIGEKLTNPAFELTGNAQVDVMILAIGILDRP